MYSRRMLTLNQVENGVNQEKKPRLILSLYRVSTKLQTTKLRKMLIAIICLEQSLVYLVDEITLLVKLYQLLLKLH